ncbi:MAG TPA: hypothetical protein VFA70_15915, partial [Dehalococcoidia bacterium]|nr:hypothetical protein [Dehalococcoidia bacterium]
MSDGDRGAGLPVPPDPLRDGLGDRLTFDQSRPGKRALTLPALDVPESPLPEETLLRDDLRLPELTQLDVVRYFTALSRL